MSVLEKYSNKKLDQRSPVHSDLVRKVNVDEDGIEHVTYEIFDYENFQRSLGTVEDWSLNSLLKAGINPDFPIRTSFSTRLEAEQYVQEFTARMDEIFPAESSVETNVETPAE